jgi:hypothetical protein
MFIDSLDVTLNAFGKQYVLSLEKNYDLFAPTSRVLSLYNSHLTLLKVTYVNGKDEATFRPRMVSYRGIH